MDINSDEKILLLGAGFSKNFGAPLANEMWYLIFNHKEIQAQPRIRKLMLDNFDYEFIYDSVLEGFEDKEGLFGEKGSFVIFRDDEKDAIREATNFAYEHIDKIFIQFMEYLENSKKEDTRQEKIITGISQFISLLPQVYALVTTNGKLLCTTSGKILTVHSKKSPFIFTLNQDSFFENCYNKFCTKKGYPEVCIPGIKEKQDKSKLVKLPTEDELYGKDILSDKKFLLLKLHGSCNWIGFDGNRAIVIGKHKEDLISKEPLLSFYFDIFKNVLSQKQRRLLIIGYGFGDDHINRVISDAVKNHELKIYILSPGSIEELNGKIKELNKKILENSDNQTVAEKRENLTTIYNGISGYFPYTEILTGDPILDKPIKEYFKSVFFDNYE